MSLYNDMHEMNQVEISPFAHRYMGTMRDLDALTVPAFGVPVIDHDFAPDHDAFVSSPGSLHSFSRRINTLIEEVPDDEQNGDVLRRNLESMDFVIGALTRRFTIGDDMAYDDYIEKVMGVRPVMVPESELLLQRTEIEAIVEDMGYRYRDSDRDKWSAGHAIPSGQMQPVVEGLVDEAKAALTEVVGSMLVSRLSEVSFRVVESEDTWQGFFGIEDGQFVIKMNSNPLLRISSLEEFIALVHEGLHGIDSVTQKQEIFKGNLSPALGIKNSFAPAYFQMEAGARGAEETVLSAETSPYSAYVYKNIKYWNDVHRNMMFKANSGSGEEEVVDYGREFLRFDEPAKLRRNAAIFAGENILFKTIFAVDGEAIRIGRNIAAMSPVERQATLERSCTEPVPTAEILAL